MPESLKSTQLKPNTPLQQSQNNWQANNKGGNFQKGGYQQNKQHQPYKSHNPATNFATYEEDEDEEPEWNEFDPEKQTGNFFGREIPEENKLRMEIET